MITKNFGVSNTSNPNPSSGDFFTETSAHTCINILASDEKETKNSEKDSDSLLVGDTNWTEEQNNDAAGYRDAEVKAPLSVFLLI